MKIPHIFIGYSHNDRAIMREVERSLVNVVRNHQATLFVDNRMEAGTLFDERLSAEIHKADLYIPLLTASFIESPYCVFNELHLAYERVVAGRCSILPVVVEECDWKNTALEPVMNAEHGQTVMKLGKLHCTLDVKETLYTLSSDQFYNSLQQAVRRELENIRKKEVAGTASRPPEPRLRTTLELDLPVGGRISVEMLRLSPHVRGAWISTGPLPDIAGGADLRGVDRPFMRPGRHDVAEILGHLQRAGHPALRLPSRAEWRSAMTTDGASTLTIRRARRQEIDPRSGDYQSDRDGLQVPCLFGEEWVADRPGDPDGVAECIRGDAGIAVRFRQCLAPFAGIQPALRLACDGDALQ